MLEIIALFSVLNPCISQTTIRQLCQIVFAQLAMTGTSDNVEYLSLDI